MEEKFYKNKFSLEGKTAIVTGALGLLGKEFCKGLAEFGANVVVVDLDEKKAEDFSKELSYKYKVKSLGIKCDVSREEDVNNMVERVLEEYPKIDILHNNAATKTDDLEGFFAPFEEYSLDNWRKVMSVNIDGMFLVAQKVGQHMAKVGGGSIIQTSSIYGLVAPDMRIYKGAVYLNKNINTPAVYTVSKAAVIGLTKYLAAYWGDKKIRVNTLILGGNESGQNETFVKNYSHKVPLGRMGYPDEMVGALIYLASDASSYVTGQSIVVDGGFSIW